MRKHLCYGKEKCERFSYPNTACFGSECFTTKLSVLALARGSHVNSDAPDPDPCPTELGVSPAAGAALVASRTAVSHPGCRFFGPGFCSGRWSLTADTHFGRVGPCSPIHIHCTQQSALQTSEVTDETSLKVAAPFF